ncbi:SRPBCC domain-containing protein [Cellulomonas xylanilytica]|uniref:Activator of HSP90 ATPase n=1 Tax=Cellulomonas xylanilytica TaxID=233583 RepID=A0A510V984_9CELL|nr:SRPBCC domain-containing protein [Cellulomonas xylanilytica]GEK21820.1 activator of HSP90 ATPase [Cellulomonas xylanilytica]
MEFGSIEREIHVDASPEVVFEVISSPEHIREWWNGAETDLSPTPGASAQVGWGDHVEPLTVIDADPPRLFSFRWIFDEGTEGPSLLVTFELVPSGAGTLLRMTETGYREKGWEVATLEAAYAEHVEGWDRFVPAIAQYAAGLVSAP